jgi:hypothetical protein
VRIDKSYRYVQAFPDFYTLGRLVDNYCDTAARFFDYGSTGTLYLPYSADYLN